MPDSQPPTTIMLKLNEIVCSGAEIYGLTILNGDIILLRHKNDVELYEQATQSRKANITVPNLKLPADVAACSVNNCVYITDSEENCVHRVAMIENFPVKKWLVNDEPSGVSITRQSNLLVACTLATSIKEYTTNGEQIREIILDLDLSHPRHALQFEVGRMVVCNGFRRDPLHRVCVVDMEGSPELTFGSQRGAKALQLSQPSHMTLYKNKYLFVADQRNKRVSVLSPVLDYLGSFSGDEERSLVNPVRVWVDEETESLYVVDKLLTGGCILIFKLS